MKKAITINQGGFSIRALLFANQFSGLDRFVLVCHGFGGSKDTAQTSHFAEKLISKYKTTGVLAFDWPCHGEDARKKLDLSECSAYLDQILSWLEKEYHCKDISAYATSFGGYLILKYIHDKGNPFRKIALRSPAVDMYHSLYDHGVDPADRDKLAKGKEILVGHDRKFKVSRDLFEELKAADVQEFDFLDFADDLLIIHGTADDTVSFDLVKDFAENNVIEFVPVEGADHRLRNPKHMDFVVHTVLEFLF